MKENKFTTFLGLIKNVLQKVCTYVTHKVIIYELTWCKTNNVMKAYSRRHYT